MKFKIGDLVQLSAAGKDRHHNHGYRGGYGMVVEIVTVNTGWPIKCQWVGGTNGSPQAPFKEYELKRKRCK